MNMKSWRTTASGVAAIVVALGGAVQLLADSNPSTNPDWNAVIAAIIAGVGLLAARDNVVTSEQALAPRFKPGIAGDFKKDSQP